MKLSTLFGISAAITGAVAITGKSSAISPKHTSTVSNVPVVSEIPGIPVTMADQVFVSFGSGEHCNITTFDREHYLTVGKCYSQDPSFTTLRTRIVTGFFSGWDEDLGGDRCVLATFTDSNCTSAGTIVQDLTDPQSDDENEEEINKTLPPGSCTEVYTKPGSQRIAARSVMWTCGDAIEEHWVDPFSTGDQEDDLSISARSVDVEHSRDHVTVAPADNLNCNSAQNRDTDTKVHGRCHSFDKPFSSLQATVHRADGDSKLGGSDPCSVLAFSDKMCRRDGAEIVDLNNTPALGVCHNVTLHHGKDHAAIAGHSWKWLCGRQNIDDCLKPIAHHSKAHTSVVNSATKTVTATTSLACTMTTEFAHYLDVLTSVFTHKPVTHTSTSVFTKTKTQVRTKLITSVATDVSTVLHSVTKPYTTTYMVCDVEQDSQA